MFLNLFLRSFSSDSSVLCCSGLVVYDHQFLVVSYSSLCFMCSCTAVCPSLPPVGASGTCSLCGRSSSRYRLVLLTWGSCNCRQGQGSGGCRRWEYVEAAPRSLGLGWVGVGHRICLQGLGPKEQSPPVGTQIPTSLGAFRAKALGVNRCSGRWLGVWEGYRQVSGALLGGGEAQNVTSGVSAQRVGLSSWGPRYSPLQVGAIFGCLLFEL